MGFVAGTLKWFAFGVALAVVAMALSYLTSFALAAIASSMARKWEHPYVSDGQNTKVWRRTNHAFHACAMIAAFGSLVLFLVGMFAASDAITHLLKQVSWSALLSERRDGGDDRLLRAQAGVALRWQMTPSLTGGFSARRLACE